MKGRRIDEEKKVFLILEHKNIRRLQKAAPVHLTLYYLCYR